MRILLVEDDRKLAKALETGLSAEGYLVSPSTTGEDGFFAANEQRFDLILLDLMLPGRGGLEILKALRSRGLRIPVLILTAKDALDDRVAGLDAGADDYLVKPFAFPELLARIRALARRGSALSEQPTTLSIADLEIDLLTRRVSRAGRALTLTVREFAVLEYLVRNQGQMVSREMLTRDVWQETSRATSLDNVIDVHIARLRKKVDPEGVARLIQTVRGVGFTMREQNE